MDEDNQNDFGGSVILSTAEGRMLMPVGERDELDADVEEYASMAEFDGVNVSLPSNCEPRIEDVISGRGMTREIFRDRVCVPIAQEVYSSDEYQHLTKAQKDKIIKTRCAANGITNTSLYKQPDNPNFDGAAAYDEDVAYAISVGDSVSQSGLQKQAADFGKMMKSNPALWAKNTELQNLQNEWNKKFSSNVHEVTGADKLDFVRDTEGSINYIMEQERDNYTAYRASEMYTNWKNSMSEDERKKITFAQDMSKKKEFVAKSFGEALDVIARNPDSFGASFAARKIETAQTAARLYQQKAQAARKAAKELQEAGEVDKKEAEKESIKKKAAEKLEKREAETQAELEAIEENIPALQSIQAARVRLNALNAATEAAAWQEDTESAEIYEGAKSIKKKALEEAKGRVETDLGMEKVQFKHGSSVSLICGVMKNFANERDPKTGKPIPIMGVPQSVFDKMVKDLDAEEDGFYLVYGRGTNAVRVQVRVAKGVTRPCLNYAAANAIYQPQGKKPLNSEQRALRKAGYKNSFTPIKNPPKTSTQK